MIIKFAFRNILRNRKRSFFTVLTIFLTAIVVGIAQGWVNGLLGLYINNYTKYMSGHIRITTEEYLKREKFLPVDELIYDSDSLIKKISGMKDVRSAQERIKFGLLLGNRDDTTESIGMGIDLEKNEFSLGSKLLEGSITEHGIFIGYKLAAKLGLKKGDELLIATKTSEGGLNGIKLPVAGIFQLKMMFDKNIFFISLNDAKTLLKIFNGSTEIIIYANDISMADSLRKSISAILPEGLKAETYPEQMGEFYGTLETMKSMLGVIEALILFLGSFVIINTMMMAIFERIREIGTMKALGMTDRDLFLNFTCEGAMLGIAGGILGATVGFLLMLLMSHNGIDFTKQFEAIDMPFEYILKPVIGIKELIIAVAISVVVPSLAAMIPARYTRKLMPAEALRK